MTGIVDSKSGHQLHQGRHVALGLAAVIAVVIFAIGLIAPLTPSEGRPSLPTLALFVALPLGLLSFAGYRARSMPARVVFAMLSAAVAVVSLWLLYI